MSSAMISRFDLEGNFTVMHKFLLNLGKTVQALLPSRQMVSLYYLDIDTCLNLLSAKISRADLSRVVTVMCTSPQIFREIKAIHLVSKY